MKPASKMERLLLILGLFLLGFFMAGWIRGTVLSRAEVLRFETDQTYNSNFSQPVQALIPDSTRPNFALWSNKRVQAFLESLTVHYSPALAVLRIPRIQLEAPILEGTDELTLNRGVGRIPNTAYPGGENRNGNIGIAGHRDGFFRGLKDISLGDRIEIVLQEGRTENYTVDRILIVPPSDVSVLKTGSSPSLSLVTCYPFYYVGTAPRRYVVQASRTDSESSGFFHLLESNLSTSKTLK